MRVFVQVVLTAVLATIAAGFLVAGSAIAQTPVSVSAPAPIAAYGGRLVWSRPVGARGFELVQRVGDGPVTRLPVPSRSVPFDVDLGPTSGGRVLAVYTRCATEPTLTSWGIPEYQTGRGCDVYKLDVGRGQEVRYTKVNASDATEFWPTYWKGRVGFARVYDSGSRASYVYVKDVASSRPSERLPGGFGGTCAVRPADCTDALRPVPLELELNGSRLAFAWRVPDEPGNTYELRVDTVGTDDRVVLDRSSSGSLTALLLGWPAFEGGRVVWARQCFGDPSGCTPARVRLSASTYTSDIVELGAPSPRWVFSHDRAGGITWVLRDSPQRNDCRDDPLTSVAEACVLEPLRPSYAPLR
ncbi:MAG: hypothetical protein ACXVSL_22445 [Solirubrobacteraceae bacterium]